MAGNVLITGGAGFIGSNLTRRLVEGGYRVTILDNLSPQVHGRNAAGSSELYRSVADIAVVKIASITSRDALESVIDGQDVVVHYAAETGTGQSMYQIERYVDVNEGGTAKLLDVLSSHQTSVSKIVVASSRSIYGEGKYLSHENKTVYPTHRREEDMLRGDFDVKHQDSSSLIAVATDEESKIHPSSVYGITKHNQESLVMTVGPTLGIASVALRYQNVFGPGQSLSNPYTGILSIFSNLIRQGKDVNVFEDGLESRDFVYIDDVVDATYRAIESDNANGEVFNVGSGVATNVNTVVRELQRAFGRSVPTRISGNFRLGDIRHNFADLTKISSKLGFVPSTSFANGVEKFVSWVESQPVSESGYERSLAEMREKSLLK